MKCFLDFLVFSSDDNPN